MAVYSIKMGKNQYRALEVTRRFKVFDGVTINLKNGECINGEIVFIDKENVYVTEPCMPIKIVKLQEITDIERWELPWR